MSSIRSRLPWSTPNLNSPLPTAILVCLVALLCYLAARVGGALVLRPQMVWPLWPGCAFLVAVLLLVPRKMWPLLIAAGLAGFVLYDLQTGLTLRSTAWLILADTIEVLIAAVGVNYAFAGVPRLNSAMSLAKYSAFAVVLAPISTAFIGTVALSGDYWLRWKTSFFTEALALLTLTPAILCWARVGRTWAPKSRAFYLEAAAMIAGLVVFSYIAFMVPERSSSPVLLYSLLPFLLWSALRFGLTGITTSIIVVAFLSIWGVVHGRGPFTGSEPLNNVMSLQLFLLFAATPFMLLAVLVEERKQAEQSLRESEKRFRLLADTAPALIWMSGTDKLCSYFNKPWMEFTGRSLESELGNGWAEGVHPEDFQKCLDTYTQSFDRREKFRMEYRLRRHDDEYRWILDIGVPRFDQDGSFIGYVGIGIDVTERKRAEEALKKSEEKFSKAFRQSPMALTLTSATDHRYLDVNETFEQMTGWLRSEVIGRAPFDFGIWVDSNERSEFVKRVLANGAIRGWEVHYRCKDGTQRVGLGAGELIQIGNELCVLSVIADITHRKQAEAKLRESEDKLRLLLDSTDEAIYGIDLEHRCTFCNPAFLRALGYERIDEVLGKNTHDLIHHSRADGTLLPVEECRVHQVTRTGIGVHTEDEVLWRADGTSFPAEYWSYPQRRGQELVGAVVAFVDITERKLAQAALANVSRKLIEAQEQERTRIGRELHDDIGQRLAMVAIELQQLHEDPLVLLEVRSRAGELQKQISEIAADTQSLSHELHSAKLQYLGIAGAIRGFCREFGEQQKVEISFQTQDLPSPLSPDISLCFFRVLQEALHNAVKHSRVRHFDVCLWGTPEEIHLTVKDSGVGFDRDAARTGRGLGLISMEERVKLVNGTLSIDSQLQRGTTVHARVPVASVTGSMSAAG